MVNYEFCRAGKASLAILSMTVIAIGKRQSRRRVRPPEAAGPPPVRFDHSAAAVLDIRDAPPDSPAVSRLVRETANAVFGSMPEVRHVEVHTPDGKVLGTQTRMPPAGPGPVSIPVGRPRPASPGPERHFRKRRSKRHRLVKLTSVVPPRHFADRYELPESVRTRIRDPEDPVDVVRAVLEAAGGRPVVEGDTLKVGGWALVILAPHDRVIDAQMLGHAFLRVEAARATSGVVIMLGFADVEDVRRRETVAPHVVHVGPSAIQRMADAVDLGLDPLRFVMLPTVGHGRQAPAR